MRGGGQTITLSGEKKKELEIGMRGKRGIIGSSGLRRGEIKKAKESYRRAF